MTEPEPKRRTYKTQTGRVLTDADFEALADEAQAGYDTAALPAVSLPLRDVEVLELRIAPELKAAVASLAEAEETSVNEVVCAILSAHLAAGRAL